MKRLRNRNRKYAINECKVEELNGAEIIAQVHQVASNPKNIKLLLIICFN